MGMSPADNKRLMQDAFEHLAHGDGRPFADLMADDFTWIITGRTAWSRAYEGKEAVREQLLGPLFAQFADRYRNTAQRFIAEGEWVVVQCRGSVGTKRGQRYDNEYCYVCRFSEGKLRELTEYLDTELVTAVLDPPPHPEHAESPARQIGTFCVPRSADAAAPIAVRNGGSRPC
jgi:ketosteroid isomerase-like protein